MLYFFTLLFTIITSAPPSLRLIIADKGEVTTVRLQKYFNDTVDASSFNSSYTCEPSIMRQYITVSTSNNLQKAASVNTVAEIRTGNLTMNVSLSNCALYKTLQIRTQPFKLFLGTDLPTNSAVLYLAIFNEPIQNPSKFYGINITDYVFKTFTHKNNAVLKCTDMTINKKDFRVYLECSINSTAFYSIRVDLLRSETQIVYNYMIVNATDTSTFSKCTERKVLYLDNLYVDGSAYRDSLMLYCPFSKREPGIKDKATTFPAALNAKNPKMTAISFSMCNQDCCKYWEQIQVSNRSLMMILNSSIWNYTNTTCRDRMVMNYLGEEFINLKLGAADWIDDYYIMTNQSLHIKYPYLANIQIIPINISYYRPAKLAVTKHYIVIQYYSIEDGDPSNRIIVYGLSNSVPKIVYQEVRTSQMTLFHTGNYFQTADYFYLFDWNASSLDMYYYPGPLLNISSVNSILTPVTDGVCLIQVSNSRNEKLDVELTLKRVSIQSLTVERQLLKYSFESQLITIPLRQHILGPLLEFYPLESSKNGFINGLTLVDTSRVDFDISSLLGLEFSSSPDSTSVQFVYARKQNMYFYKCELQFKDTLNTLVLGNCEDSLLGPSILLPPYMSLTGIKMYAVYDKNKFYILHDGQNVIFCPRSATTCQLAQLEGTPTIAQTVFVAGYYPSIMVLDATRKSIRMHYYNRTSKNYVLPLQLEINSSQLVDLRQSDVQITQFQVDDGFKNFLFIMLNTSVNRIYVLQRQASADAGQYLCHVTSVIQAPNKETKFKKFFLVGSQKYNYKLLVLEELQEVTKLKQYSIQNAFDIRYSREYSLYDYNIENNIPSFNDQGFVYIGATRRYEFFYLVYDPQEVTPNLLSYRIPINFSTPGKPIRSFPASLNGQQQSVGLGMIGKHLYALGDMQFIQMKTSTINSRPLRFTPQSLQEQSPNTTIRFGLKNDNNDLNFVNIQVQLDLQSSQITYHDSLPQVNFAANDSIQSANVSISSTNLTGPVEDIDIFSNCSNIKFTEKQLLSAFKCLEYSTRKFGKVKSFISLRNLENTQVAITDKYLLCIQNQVPKIASPKSPGNCTMRLFNAEKDGQQLLLVCYTQPMTLQLMKVNAQCEISLQQISITSIAEYRYFDVKTWYPFILLQAPILLPENKDYYLCKYNNDTNQVANCSQLIYNTQDSNQDNFLSKDYDIRDNYTVIFEEGLGIFPVVADSHKLVQTVWITPSQLQEIGIYKPYSFVKIREANNDTQSLLLAVGTLFQFFEIRLQLRGRTLQAKRVEHTYHKYLGCQYSKESEPRYHPQGYTMTICSLSPQISYRVGRMFPLQETASTKFIMVFQRSRSSESWPVHMEEVLLTQTYALSGNYLVASSISNVLCYYQIGKQIGWTVEYYPQYTKTKPVCVVQVSLFNRYFSNSLNLKINFEQSGEDLHPVAQWLIRGFAGMLLLILPMFYYLDNRKETTKEKSKKQALKIKKKISGHNFYSNQFENNLRLINRRD